MNSHHNILINYAHWNNRGDETTLRSLIDKLIENGDALGVQLQTSEIHQFPYDNIESTEEYPRLRNLPGFILSIFTNFRFIPQKGKHLIRIRMM